MKIQLVAAAGALAAAMAGEPAFATGIEPTVVSTQAQNAAAADYDGKDPETTGCANGATTAATQRTTWGTFELRWSPRCKTNWIRVSNFAGGRDQITFEVWRESPFKSVVTDVPATPGLHWSDMVYAPGCAKGLALFQPYSGPSRDTGLLASSDC